ncbi:MAG: LLM class flavin-dependent oxidoreductase [Rhodospirillaceae bacterium]|jgi:alkanesulfonate monooxygenase SsuD/methylene tetrahydromethanopterin reductase-like flavin-dependent oxidoreductase (luciferase family)|nr:LLM class flavin-dependent oxidoreductase [Rhodospirillaceae bacterium]
MEFGIFDHVDRSDLPLHEYYEARLELVELYDKAGFYSYHIAEHHATPLGLSPSPAVFLSAVAQRTKKLRFGPMIFALPLYDPFRLLEEICMLDQMSGGRLDMGFGRGASPIELGMFGVDPADAERIYGEGLEVILQGLADQKLNYKGDFYTYEDVPVALDSFQKPHPPLWYGVHSLDSAARAARNGHNVLSLDDAALTRTLTDSYRAARTESGKDREPEPKIGIGRFIVLADSDEEAMSIAQRGYTMWHESFNYLFRLRGSKPRHPRAPTFDGLCAEGQGMAGSPETIIDYLSNEMSVSGANYLVSQFSFGSLTQQETVRSIELFADRVMPALRGA